MPIMDGYESCKLIDNYLNDSTPILAPKELLKKSLNKKNRALIYSLTSDYSEFTKNRLR